jgi:uncharacterized protein (TIGR03437 family)
VTATNAYGASPASDASNPVTPVAPLSIVNAASYVGLAATPGYLGTLFGASLAPTTEVATTRPLPTTLAGTSLMLVDSTGQQIPLSLYFVSPEQINFAVPESAKAGPATLRISSGATITEASVMINPVQPGLFSASQKGLGPGIGNVLHVNADQSSFYTTLSQCTGSDLDTCANVPVQFSSPDEKIFLSLYGTGFRGRSSLDGVVVTVNGISLPVLYAGPQPTYPGMDQLNVELPYSLRGLGEVVLKTLIDGQVANEISVLVP